MCEDGWSHVFPVLDTGKKFHIALAKLVPFSDQKVLGLAWRALNRSMPSHLSWCLVKA